MFLRDLIDALILAARDGLGQGAGGSLIGHRQNPKPGTAPLAHWLEGFKSKGPRFRDEPCVD